MSALPLTESMLTAIEDELQRQIARLDSPRMRDLREMLAYHMGWSDPLVPTEAAGKRVRPLILLLVAASVDGNWPDAVPAAAAIELIHNFSLVHDDIQDNSPTRRGRAALWKKYGTPMAINAGDTLFAIANYAALDLSKVFEADLVLRVSAILQQACLELTGGQFLDLAYEGRIDLSTEDYWPMVEAKTAALLAASAQLGAILGGASETTVDQYRAYARLLGLAFQVQDDVLGIWGNEALTGKSTASDLVQGKSTLPVLYALSRDQEFSKRWASAHIEPHEVRELAQGLARVGAQEFSLLEGRRLTEEARGALRRAQPRGAAGAELATLTEKLIGRAA